MMWLFTSTSTSDWHGLLHTLIIATVVGLHCIIIAYHKYIPMIQHGLAINYNYNNTTATDSSNNYNFNNFK
jgi:hypothetical protein